MNHYKSWSGIKKQLSELLCDSLRNRITYFLTHYNKVHDSYGRAAIRLDGKKLVCFSWINMYRQEDDISQLDFTAADNWGYDSPEIKAKWDAIGQYYEDDFLEAALTFLNLPIEKALESDNYIIKIFAIMDRRTGKRTLQRIKENGQYLYYPEWAKQFYQLRLEIDKI
ncbi:MAG: hypothetical protein IJZ85_08575 [Lachnospiraceae bacterium]|nr:hypothetical protein [Lachnospiraceae bacterium]